MVLLFGSRPSEVLLTVTSPPGWASTNMKGKLGFVFVSGSTDPTHNPWARSIQPSLSFTLSQKERKVLRAFILCWASASGVIRRLSCHGRSQAQLAPASRALPLRYPPLFAGSRSLSLFPTYLKRRASDPSARSASSFKLFKRSCLQLRGGHI